MDRKVTEGNVFKDLGFTNEEAIALAVKVDAEIEKELKKDILKQEKVCI